MLHTTDAVLLADNTQKRARDVNSSFWVTASAGSGKTKLLCERVVSLLCHGVDARSIVCLTYTKAAAAEMKQRVLDILEKIAKNDVKYADFRQILLRRDVDAVAFCLQLIDKEHDLSFQTIHGFCEKLLRRFPIEADLSPDFRVLDEKESFNALKNAAESFYDIDNIAGKENDAKLLAQYLRDDNYGDLFAPLLSKRDMLYHVAIMSEEEFREKLSQKLQIHDEKRTIQELKSQLKSHLSDELIKRLENALAISGSDKDQETLKNLHQYLNNKDFEAYKNVFFTQHGEIRKKPFTKQTKLSDDDLTALHAEAQRIAQLIQIINAVECLHATCILRHVVIAIWAYYIELKTQSNEVDFDDLLDITHRLLQHDNLWVQYKLQQSIQHILIDEAQDTNAKQWDLIVKLLQDNDQTETPKTLLVVGDYKQSIYSFQGADPDAYLRQYQIIKQLHTTNNQAFTELHLNTSFRTLPQILNVVDTVFQKTDATYGVVKNENDTIIHLPSRIDGENHQQVILHPKIIFDKNDGEKNYFYIPNEYRTGKSNAEITANVIGQQVAELLRSQKKLACRNNRVIQADDIWIILQKRSALQQALLNDLKQRGIAVAGTDRIYILQHLAIRDLLAIILFMIDYDDDLTLAAILKCPLFNITDDELYDLSYSRSGNLWTELRDNTAIKDNNIRLANACHTLQYLINNADMWTPYQIFSYILYEMNGYNAFRCAFGVEVDEVLHLLMNYALRFQQDNIPSLSGFLIWFYNSAADVKRETVGSGVRIMTIHSSKGLEAPVIILGDVNYYKSAKYNPIMWLDDVFVWRLSNRKLDVLQPFVEKIKQDDKKEYHRLLYVAMTRAED